MLAKERRLAAATHLLPSGTDIRMVQELPGAFGCGHDDDLHTRPESRCRSTSTSPLDSLALNLQPCWMTALQQLAGWQLRVGRRPSRVHAQMAE